MDVYSPLKVFHHQDRLQILRAGQQPAPAQVQMILSDLCNQDCSFCAYRTSGYTSNELFKVVDAGGAVNNNPNRMLTYEKIIEILDDLVTLGTKAVQLTGGGEPTIHPRFEEILNALYNRQQQVGLVTNGTRLHKFTGQLVRENVKWVRVSVDAGCAESYATIRRVSPAGFERAWANITELCRARDLAHRQDLIVGVGFVVTNKNWSEVVACAKRAKEAGVDNLRISAIFQSEDFEYFRDFFSEAREACREAATLAEGRFRVFNMFGDRVDDLKLQNPDYEFCGYQHFTTYIGGDQNVYRCCVYAYNPRGLIGSIENQRFIDVWQSQFKQDDFAKFDARDCERCQFNGKNRMILYALRDQPEHVEFV